MTAAPGWAAAAVLSLSLLRALVCLGARSLPSLSLLLLPFPSWARECLPQDQGDCKPAEVSTPQHFPCRCYLANLPCVPAGMGTGLRPPRKRQSCPVSPRTRALDASTILPGLERWKGPSYAYPLKGNAWSSGGKCWLLLNAES